MELEFLLGVIRRQTERPCSFSRSETGLDEFARITHRITRLEHLELRLIEREVSRLLAEGFFCDVCRWKLCLFVARWFSEPLPLVAWSFRSQVPGQLAAAGSRTRPGGRDRSSNLPLPPPRITPGDPILVMSAKDEVLRCRPRRFLQKFG